MKLLRTIEDAELRTGVPRPGTYHQRREASRAIVFDTEGKVGLLHATNKNFHKLPGGGLEEGEDMLQALEREVLEEIGCAITDIKELGVVEEYRNKFGLHQISYCFTACVTGAKGTPNLMEDEITDGFETVWMSLDAAIATLAAETPVEDYEGKFIQLRDLTLLKAASNPLR